MNKANVAKKQSTSNIITDYKVAMQVFNNELLTEACQLLLSNSSNHDKSSGEKRDEKFQEIYKRCYKASETISKVESLPGFSLNIAPQQKQPHRIVQMPSSMHRKGSFGSATTSNAPVAGFQPKKNHVLQKPNSLKRSVSAGSSASITSSLTSNHSTRRSTASPTPMLDDGKRALPPATAMKFLQALNKKTDSSSKASSGTKRGAKSASSGQPTKRMRKMSREEKEEEEEEFLEDDSSSSGEEEEFEVEKNAEASKEYEKDDNTSKSKRRSNGKAKKNAPTEETGETFGVGEDVLVYYEPDDKWYEAIVSNVNTEKVEDSKSDEGEGDKNTKTISRRSARGQGGRSNKQSSDEKSNLKIVSYDVEYDNGEHHENVAPINIQGREH